MGEHTPIPWTDHSQNFWQGCRKVSSGCEHCYMHRDKKRWGQDPAKIVRSSDATFYAPLKWREPARVFACSWSDFFIEEADPWRAEAWDVIRRTPHLTWQILTKRPENIADRLPPDWGEGWPHVWLGFTAEDQDALQKRAEIALWIPAALWFVSVEPMLEPLDFHKALRRWHCACGWHGRERELSPSPSRSMVCPQCGGSGGLLFRHFDGLGGIDWVVAGCESGPKARPAQVDWFRSLRDQCQSAGVPFFLKQMTVDGKLTHNPELDGRRWQEFPRGNAGVAR